MRERIVSPWLCAAVLIAAATGCSDQVLDTVKVCGDLAVPAELTAVRVTVLTERDGVFVERADGVVVLAREDLVVADDTTQPGDLVGADTPDTPDTGEEGDTSPVDASTDTNDGKPGGSPLSRQLPVEVGVPRLGEVRVIRAQALAERSEGAGESEVLRAEVLVAGRTNGPIVLNLSRDCLGRVCPLGQTCRGGVCTIIPESGDACLQGGTR